MHGHSLAAFHTAWHATSVCVSAKLLLTYRLEQFKQIPDEFTRQQVLLEARHSVRAHPTFPNLDSLLESKGFCCCIPERQVPVCCDPPRMHVVWAYLTWAASWAASSEAAQPLSTSFRALAPARPVTSSGRCSHRSLLPPAARSHTAAAASSHAGTGPAHSASVAAHANQPMLSH